MPTYGAAGQPLQSTYNYDALVATSLANYRGTLIDNISTLNLVFKLVHDKGMWEPADGGLHLIEDLMYGLSPVQWYDGLDELSLAGAEGITQAQFDWAQCAAPISISEKERKQNKHRIVNLVESKIMQAEISIKEHFAKAFLRGSLATGGSDIRTPATDPATGATAITPLPLLVSYTPTTGIVGGINRALASNSWWRNRTKTSAATTYLGFIQEVLHMYHDCSKGPGGPPDWILCDQTTFELLQIAFYAKYQTMMKEVGDFPFPVVRFQKALVSWDEYVPNVAANASAGSIDTEAANGGTMYFGNSQFFKVRPESETDFVYTDQQRPINQDAKYRHILWMGNSTINNSRKFGVIGNIARTLT